MYLGQSVGRNIKYDLLDAALIPEFSLNKTIIDLKEQGWAGVNITQPFKQEAWRLATRFSDIRSEALGACNTLKFSSEELLGSNTDLSGFRNGYIRKFKEAPAGRVAMLGAGGVGRSVAFALVELGATELYLFDNDQVQADSLQGNLAGASVKVCKSSGEFFELAREADGLVNCTPCGMYYMPESAFPSHIIGGQNWVFDAVYTPLETEFVKICINQGISVLSGYDLWIHQGLDAFELFTGMRIELSDELMRTTLSWLG